jgi:hypothetical protein
MANTEKAAGSAAEEEEIIELARLIVLNEKVVARLDSALDALDGIAQALNGIIQALSDVGATLTTFLEDWQQANASGGPAVAGAVTWGAPQPKP